MFTGLVEELGTVIAVSPNTHGPSADAARLTIAAPRTAADAAHGASIAVNGVCLTVVDGGADTADGAADGAGAWFTADVMAETLSASALAGLAPGDRVNLERAAELGDRLGGHLVQGHVDGVGRVLARRDGGAWRVVRFALPQALAALVAHKGSIAVDGVSLTVSAVSEPEAAEPWFEVSLIPETLAATTLGTRDIDDAVNLETDLFARQVERAIAVALARRGVLV